MVYAFDILINRVEDHSHRGLAAALIQIYHLKQREFEREINQILQDIPFASEPQALKRVQ